MSEQNESLGLAIDRLDSITHGLKLPLASATHVEQLRTILPEIVIELKAGFVAATGENPWEDEP